MKVGLECAFCLFQRGYLEILEATEDSSLRFETCRNLLQMLAENFDTEAVPSIIGTKRERLVKKGTHNEDPFAAKKEQSNKEALKILPFAKKIVLSESSLKERFRKACLSAIVGNIMEFNIPGHEFEFKDIGKLITDAEKDLVIDDISEAYNLARKSTMTMFLADNAGEIALDTLLVKELKNLGGRVIVAVKDKPAYNDATLKDALAVGLDRIADEVITIGTDSMGLIPSECSEEFLEYYGESKFIIAKGMGYAETLTEYDLKVPHLLLLRTKCSNVAKYFGVERHKNVAKILGPR